MQIVFVHLRPLHPLRLVASLPFSQLRMGHTQVDRLKGVLSSCENWTIDFCTLPKISNMGTWKKTLWKRRNNIYKPLNSRFHANFLGCKFLKFTTCSSHFSLSHFHPQGFPNIWSHLCYKKIQLGYAIIVLSSLLWMPKFQKKYLDQINQVISPLYDGVCRSMSLWVKPSSFESSAWITQHLVFPKGGCTKMLGNSNSWTVWQSKTFTISKQMMWWEVLLHHFQKQSLPSRDLFWESSLLVDLTSASQEVRRNPL